MVVIEVAATEAAPDGKKVAHVITTTGAKLEIWPDKLAAFAVGKSYNVELKAREWNGRTYQAIGKFSEFVAPAKPVVAASNVTPMPRSQAPTAAEALFVGQALGGMLASCRSGHSHDELIQAVTALRHLWRATFGQADAHKAAAS